MLKRKRQQTEEKHRSERGIAIASSVPESVFSTPDLNQIATLLQTFLLLDLCKICVRYFITVDVFEDVRLPSALLFDFELSICTQSGQLNIIQSNKWLRRVDVLSKSITDSEAYQHGGNDEERYEGLGASMVLNAIQCFCKQTSRSIINFPLSSQENELVVFQTSDDSSNNMHICLYKGQWPMKEVLHKRAIHCPVWPNGVVLYWDESNRLGHVMSQNILPREIELFEILASGNACSMIKCSHKSMKGGKQGRMCIDSEQRIAYYISPPKEEYEEAAECNELTVSIIKIAHF